MFGDRVGLGRKPVRKVSDEHRWKPRDFDYSPEIFEEAPHQTSLNLKQRKQSCQIYTVLN